jgi:hypothetical protein
MKLPNAEHAEIDLRKLNEYLLSTTHPIGRSKSVFFSEIGYNQSNTEALKRARRFTALNTSLMD